MKNKKLLLSCFFFMLFLIIMLLVVLGKTTGFDQAIYQAIISCREDFFDFYFITITKLANTVTIIFIVLLFVLLFRNKDSLFLVVSSVDCLLLNTIFKYIVRRSRPMELRLISQGGYSFPSGHTVMAVCFYGYFLYLALTKIKNKVFRYCVSFLLILVILSIGVSRIYVGVHFASDVLGGYCLGFSYLLLLIYVKEKYYVKGE